MHSKWLTEVEKMATNGTMTTLYYLLLARHGSDHMRGDYPYRWKLKLMSTVFQYGPTWSKRLELQDKIRNLSDEELQKGTVTIYNNARNPNTAPGADTWTALPGINSQNQTLNKRGLADAYATADAILRIDVTEEFLARFDKFFGLMATGGDEVEYDFTHIAQMQNLDLQYVSGDANEDLFDGSYLTATFEEMFPSVSDWLDFYRTCGIPTTIPEV